MRTHHRQVLNIFVMAEVIAAVIRTEFNAHPRYFTAVMGTDAFHHMFTDP